LKITVQPIFQWLIPCPVEVFKHLPPHATVEQRGYKNTLWLFGSPCGAGKDG